MDVWTEVQPRWLLVTPNMGNMQTNRPIGLGWGSTQGTLTPGRRPASGPRARLKWSLAEQKDLGSFQVCSNVFLSMWLRRKEKTETLSTLNCLVKAQ